MGSAAGVLLSSFCFVHFVLSSSDPIALSIPPSLYWDGVDGSWSTFHVQVGTPGQTVRLLPGTSANAGNAIWAVIPEGCSATYNANISNCANERGYVFKSNTSTTWSSERLSNGGLYELDTYVEGSLGYDGNAYYGFDTVSLGLEGSALPILHNQLVAGIASNNYWLGSLGISPIPHNFTTLDSPVRSMLSTLRETGQIASTSWGYTAGSSYLSSPVFGSLTLIITTPRTPANNAIRGGYDEAQLDASKTLSAIPFGADFTRDLMVDLQSITHNALGSSPLLSQGVSVFIDSMVTAMWLPIPVCKEFEKAFGLEWDSSSEMYLLSTSQHNALLDQNPTLTLTLGSGSKTVDIKFPYAAFDLEISPPLVSSKSYYFPLKQAQNESQYTLGRVFLQEAYVVADYDRQQFQVSQAAHPGTDVEQKITTLYPTDNNSTQSGSGSGSGSDDGKDSGIGTGTTAAIAVAAAAIAALTGIAVWFFLRRKKKSTARAELSGEEIYEHRSDEKDPDPSGTATPLFAEMGAEGTAIHEVGSESKVELDAPHATFYEMPDKGEVAEKDGFGVGTPQPIEMDASPRFELDGGYGGWEKAGSDR
ncbi:uncharacterized protein LTR77_010473 [Saxophila tyrrhenica]|uniref:Peptidase A1 domain-containing protein n=1 Tax=Saxophila tyrrhenica TaxID=1690608 RepID=A0AAV9NZG9_9PEZI|nr:hypothetical protein LTR77_010473 [Saxophila tyrrhenica]